jgi:hypothetical protein
LIKGIILFLAFGLLYFIFTLFIEYFLWLKPSARTVLFWLFILVETILFSRYIILPVFKLIGFAKGISLADASKIIGKHFSEIDDKLLNMLQLHQSNPESELAIASIEQKAQNLQPIPFKKAIRYTGNKKYLKYLIIPFLIGILLLLSGKIESFNESYTRIINHQKTYLPPAPFNFELDDMRLEVLEGSDLQLKVTTVGEVVPDEAKIVFDNEDYFLKNTGAGTFTYSFESLTKPFSFHLEANDVRSQDYQVRIIPVPKIQHIIMEVYYPKYIHKKNERITNTGNIIVPVGTQIVWQINTQQTDSLRFVSDGISKDFSKEKGAFVFTKNIRNDLNYSIIASNKYLSDFEKLTFSITVLKDAYPTMDIVTDIDSISVGNAQFIGKLADDYGLSKLDLVYYNQRDKSLLSRHRIAIPQTNIASFYYVFPTDLDLLKGVDYEFYFELFDNDFVTGPKSTKSAIYHYHKDTNSEQEEKLLKEQKESLTEIEKNLKKGLKNNKKIKNFTDELKNKTQLEYNDASRLQQFMNRQKEYQTMMQRQTDQLQQNIDKQPQSDNLLIEEKKNDILKRIEETKELIKENKLLEELEKLADKLNKEDLLDKLNKLSSNSKQKEKSLEQLLELTKRFYVEQKAEQIKQSIEELAKKQEKLAETKDNTADKQNNLNDTFDDIKKSIDQLEKDNKELKEPMPFDMPKPEQESISEDMNNASKDLKNNKQSSAEKKQKSAAKKMKQMAQSLQMQMMSAQGDMIEEDIALLREIIENLINFSYRQEDLMELMATDDDSKSTFSRNLKEQYKLQEYFEHIDDSLYVLSMRQPKLSAKINTHLADAHYYLESSLAHYADNQYNKANSDQHFIMKSANDLALLLSRLLDNMQSQMGKGSGQGKGKGQSGASFSLPDIIKQQKDLGSSMSPMGKSQGEEGDGKEGKGDKNAKDGKKGNQANQKQKQGGSANGLSDAEIFSIYQQQARLRNALEKQLDDMQSESLKRKAGLVISEMEDLEKRILEKGITNDVVQRMLELEYKLLQLKEAKEKQEQDTKRESNKSQNHPPKKSPEQIEFYIKFYKQREILNRENLPLKIEYIKKVKEYFKDSL